jgi:hypothetical protein
MEQHNLECAVCKKVFHYRFEVHTQADNSKKGWRYICCECLGHDALECLKEYKRF